MPQKKNPDIPELIRGKTGRVLGNLVALATLLKGLPLTYNRDLQEDKEPIFDTVDTVGASLAITAELLRHVECNQPAMAQATKGGFMTATDLADYLVIKDIPFRQAHALVGRIVASCIEQGKELTDLNLAELQAFAPQIQDDIFATLSVEGSVASRVSTGGTAPARVEAALLQAEKRLGMVP
jgi:argininosuccinate lyase